MLVVDLGSSGVKGEATTFLVSSAIRPDTLPFRTLPGTALRISTALERNSPPAARPARPQSRLDQTGFSSLLANNKSKGLITHLKTTSIHPHTEGAPLLASIRSESAKEEIFPIHTKNTAMGGRIYAEIRNPDRVAEAVAAMGNPDCGCKEIYLCDFSPPLATGPPPCH
ncbi:hypothetical protein BASA82_000668 [Batrachochytrium salamandrivorans]|nr:hypothetical protein BASA82_000668 [Batrachochytrium salamandrivorans]